MVPVMDEAGKKSWRRNGHFGRKWPEPRSEFPAMPYPENARFSIKQVAYLHAFCGKEPRDIVARYPRTISLAQVHLALFYYFTNQAVFDAEIAADLHWDRRKSLDEPSMVLPSMRAATPAGASKDGAS